MNIPPTFLKCQLLHNLQSLGQVGYKLFYYYLLWLVPLWLIETNTYCTFLQHQVKQAVIYK